MDKLKTPIRSSQLNESSLPAPSTSARDRALFAAERAAILFGCYRKGDANDPEMYTAAITAILAEYAEEVIQHVTDPRTGLARKTNWLPTVAEVDLACMAQSQFVAKRDQLVKRGWAFTDGKWVKPGEAA